MQLVDKTTLSIMVIFLEKMSQKSPNLMISLKFEKKHPSVWQKSTKPKSVMLRIFKKRPQKVM